MCWSEKNVVKGPDGHFESFPGIRDAIGGKGQVGSPCSVSTMQTERERAVQRSVTGGGCWVVKAGGGWRVVGG